MAIVCTTNREPSPVAVGLAAAAGSALGAIGFNQFAPITMQSRAEKQRLVEIAGGGLLALLV